MKKEIRFTKMEGAGNDYIYIDLFEEEEPPNPKELAVAMSDRHFGIGGDGLIFIAPGNDADLRMVMRNADGSLSEMCGNAIRCAGKYAWDRGRIKRNPVTVETGAGILTLELKMDRADRVKSVKASMGVPILNGLDIPSKIEGDPVKDRELKFDGFTLRGTLVSMGNPHFITYVNDVDSIPIDVWGPAVENDRRFPGRINVEFVQTLSSGEVRQRTWERGSGETMACGTGAAAVCVAGVLNEQTESPLIVRLRGGALTLNWAGLGEQVYMEGPAREVFSGIWSG